MMRKRKRLTASEIQVQLAVFAIFGIVWHVNFPNTPLLNENGVPNFFCVPI